MTNLENLLLLLETARKNATQGEWQNTPMLTVVTDPPSCEFTGIPIVVQSGRGTGWNKNVDADCKFIALSANNILKLIKIIRVQNEALKQLNLHTHGLALACIEQALAKVNEIAGGE